MSTSRTITDPTPSSTQRSTTTRRRAGSITLWTLQVLLAAAFVMAGQMKLAGDPVVMEMFDEIGAGDWLRYLVGTAEVAGGLGLLVPRLCGLAALGLTALLVGATFTNVVVLDVAPWAPLAYLVPMAVIAWARRDRTCALFATIQGR